MSTKGSRRPAPPAEALTDTFISEHTDPPDTRVRRVLIECVDCGYLDAVAGVLQDNVYGRARELLAEHQRERGCRGAEWRMETVALDSDVGRMDISRALAAIDVADLLGEEI